MIIDGKETHNQEELDEMLLAAVESNHLDSVKSLVQKGACIESKMNSRPLNMDPLFHASACDYDDIVAYFIDAGVDVSARECASLTTAVIRNSSKALRLLVEAGADIHVRGDKPIRYAIDGQHQEIISILYKADPSYYLELFKTDPELSNDPRVEAFVKHYNLSFAESRSEHDLGEPSRIKRERLRP